MKVKLLLKPHLLLALPLLKLEYSAVNIAVTIIVAIAVTIAVLIIVAIEVIILTLAFASEQVRHSFLEAPKVHKEVLTFLI